MNPLVSTLKNLSPLLAVAVFAAGCSTTPLIEPIPDGPPPKPFDASSVPNPVPRSEPRSAYGNPSSYVVRGVRYYVMPSSAGYRERGNASWYGKKFHGRRTSNGETYDMFGMTAAHRTLPLPSYVRVTNVENNQSIIVRVNDRGPFHPDRVLDLSYVAALKLDIVNQGVGLVDIEVIDTDTYQPQPNLRATTAPSRTVELPPPYTAPELPPLQRRYESAPARPATVPQPILESSAPAAIELEQISAPIRTLPSANRNSTSPSRGSLENTGSIQPSTIYQPEYEILPGKKSSAGIQFFLQAGAFTRHENLQERMDKLLNLGFSNLKTQESLDGSGVNRIFVGPFGSETEAQAAQAQIGASEIKSVIVQR